MDDDIIHFRETRDFRKSVKFSDCRTPLSHAVDKVLGGWAVTFEGRTVAVFPTEQEAEFVARGLNEDVT